MVYDGGASGQPGTGVRESLLRGICGVWTRRFPYLHWLRHRPRLRSPARQEKRASATGIPRLQARGGSQPLSRGHPAAGAEDTITEPTETPTTVPDHHAGEDKPASGTGEVWDLSAPPSTSGAATLPLTQRAPSRGCRRHPGQTGGDPTAKGQLKTGPPGWAAGAPPDMTQPLRVGARRGWQELPPSLKSHDPSGLRRISGIAAWDGPHQLLKGGC